MDKVVPSKLCPAHLLPQSNHDYLKKYHQILDPTLLPKPQLPAP